MFQKTPKNRSFKNFGKNVPPVSEVLGPLVHVIGRHSSIVCALLTKVRVSES